MSKKILIFDTTLRDGEQTPGVTLTQNEKVEIAKQLERLGVDTLEAGFAIASQGDFNAVSAIANEVKNSTVASLCRALPKDIDRAYEAVKNAQNPMIHTFLATSDIHLKYKLKMSRDEVLEQAREMVKYAKNYLTEVEFSAEDASRSDKEFLYKVFEAVIASGATRINVPDTVGYTNPEEFGELIKGIMNNVSGIEKAIVSVHCHNDLGLAVANSLAAVKNGATQVECTINGLGERAGNASLEEVVMNLAVRGDYYGFTHNIDTTQIYRTSKLVSSLSGIMVPPNKAIVGGNAFAHESGIHQHGVLSEKTTYEIITPESVGVTTNKMVLGKLSGRHAFVDRLKEMGYENLSSEAIDKAFKAFKDLADRKKDIQDDDIEALLEERLTEVSQTYELEFFQINSGNRMVSTATICIKNENLEMVEAATGDGPVDALFKAINRVVGIDFKLKDYSLRAVTGGTDALGEVTVRVENDDVVCSGKGISTDIIDASCRAYLNAINRYFAKSN